MTYRLACAAMLTTGLAAGLGLPLDGVHAAEPATAPLTLGDLAAAPPPRVEGLRWEGMPDVVGVHLGMPADAAIATLKREYPTRPLQVWEIAPHHRPTIEQRLSNGVSLRPDAGAPFGDQVELHFTHPPNAPVVFAVSRLAQRQHVNRDTLLAALRKKYGQESATNPDAVTRELWWVFDAQGRRVEAPSGGTLVLGECRWPTVGGSIDDMTRNRQSPWCESWHIAVHARLESHADPAIVELVHVRMIHLPLGLQAARATIAWRDALHDGQREQEVERTRNARPRL